MGAASLKSPFCQSSPIAYPSPTFLFPAEDPSDKYSPWQYKAPEEVELLGASDPDHNLSSSSLTESLKPSDSGKSDSVQSGGVVKPVVKPGLIDPAVIDAAVLK